MRETFIDKKWWRLYLMFFMLDDFCNKQLFAWKSQSRHFVVLRKYKIKVDTN